MNKVVISVAGLLCNLCLFTGEGVRDALGALSQSLEMLSQTIKKKPFVDSQCFKVVDNKIQFDHICALENEPNPIEKYRRGSELMEIMKIAADTFYTVFLRETASDSIKQFGHLKIPVINDKTIADAVRFYLTQSDESDTYVSLILILFYKESINPGSWNDNFDTFLTGNVKDNWLKFMDAFREKMIEQGWNHSKSTKE